MLLIFLKKVYIYYKKERMIFFKIKWTVIKTEYIIMRDLVLAGLSKKITDKRDY